jgi:hypothetical protein
MIRHTAETTRPGEHNECLAKLEKVRYKDVVVVVAVWERQMPFSERMYHDVVDRYGGARYVGIHVYSGRFRGRVNAAVWRMVG